MWLGLELTNPMKALTSPGQACGRLQTKEREVWSFLALLEVFFLLSLAGCLQRKQTTTPRDPQVLDAAIRAVSYMRLMCVLTASHLPSRRKASVQQPQSEADTGRQ